MADNDPMEPLKIVAEQAILKLKEAGLETVNIAFMPNLEGGPHLAQIVCALSEEAVGELVEKDETDKEADALFAGLEREMKKEKEAEKEAEALQGLERLAKELEQGKGILGDDS